MALRLRVLGWVGLALLGPILLQAEPLVGFVSVGNLVIFVLHAIAAVGLTLIMGFAGQVSLGHAAFYGVGAYSTAILTVELGWPPIAAIVAGMALAAGLAGIVGRIVFRLHGHFLAMATLAFGLVFFFAVRGWDSVTGGNAGRGGIPKLAVGPFQATTGPRMFLLTWVVLVLGLLVARNVVRSRTGRALAALGASEVASATAGVNVVRAKVAVFALGAAYASLAGSLYAHYVNYIAPDAFGLLPSIRFLVISTVGGLESVLGAPVGSALVMLLTESARRVVPIFVRGATGSYEIILYGLALVVVLVLFNRGIAGAVEAAWRGWRLRGAEEPTPAEGAGEPEERVPA